MISIRKATAEDAPLCWQIRCDAILNFCIGHYPRGLLEVWTEGGTPQSFPQMVEDHFFLGSVDGEIVGTGAIDLGSGKIDGIFVAPAKSGIGVGRTMMAHLESLARAAGLESLHLESTLNAADFYRRCGFSGSEISEFRSLRGITLDCIPMTRDLRQPGVQLRPMTVVDLPEISALGIRSKAVWGYSAGEMRIFSEELTLNEGEFKRLHGATVAIVNGERAGYVTLRTHPDGTMELEHLFVSPEHLRRGIGSILLESALDAARKAGADALTIVSDPNAAGFYTRHGAKVVGEHPSSIAGRSIPILSMSTSAR